jgi:Dyp-type peroxidase family
VRAVVDRIQPGIYFRPGQKPPPYYRLLLLDVVPGAAPERARDGLARVLGVVEELSEGRVRELAGQDRAETDKTKASFRGLDLLVGFGRRLFDDDLHDPPLTREPRPDHLAYLPSRGDAFPALPWAAGPGPRNQGEADIALQLTGASEAAVNRAAVEVWKVVLDEGLPFEAVSTYGGFGRADGRGWLEFHDGVSNMDSGQRLAAIEALPDPPWMAGGTYMAFLRLAVDLAAWRALPRPEQELIVGRDKLTGSPLVGVRRDPSGRAVPVAAPSVTEASTDAERADRADPPQALDPLLEASHLHRANQNRASPFAPAGQRIFRQGYDFLESVESGAPRLGLNFVSFQGDLASVQHILHLPGWLGDVNFGGPSEPGPGEPGPLQLLTLQAGGFYAVPARAHPFPGADLFAGSGPEPP